jgi:hypothetical protein
MERTILFRGIIKYPDDIFKGFCYGNLIIYANGDTFIRQIETGQEFEVIPETVGEFTGLTDKNGVKVFEGDKLKTDFFAQYIVEDLRDFYIWLETDFYNDPETEIEVIGNIHDKHVL